MLETVAHAVTTAEQVVRPLVELQAPLTQSLQESDVALAGVVGVLGHNQSPITESLLRKKQEASILLDVTKDSFVQSWEKFRSRSRLGKLGLVGAGLFTVGFTYGDDVALFTADTALREKVLPAVLESPTVGRAIAFTAIGAASAGLNLLGAHRNEKEGLIMESAKRPQPEITLGHDPTIGDVYSHQMERGIRAASKLGGSLMVGAPLNRAANYMTKTEKVVHSAVYGATAAALYDLSVNLGFLDKWQTVAAAAGILVGRNYVSEKFRPDLDVSVGDLPQPKRITVSERQIARAKEAALQDTVPADDRPVQRLPQPRPSHRTQSTHRRSRRGLSLPRRNHERPVLREVS